MNRGMNLIRTITLIAIGAGITSAFADDKRDQLFKDLEALKAELKPLRQKAYLESEVIAARQKLDDAYRAYWESVRIAMIKLDPSKTELIEKDIALRKEIGPVMSGSRANDYEKKAAEQNPKKSQ